MWFQGFKSGTTQHGSRYCTSGKVPSVYECSGMQIPRADVLEALLSIEPSKYQLGVAPSEIRSFIKSTS